jgi:poly-gamma-glutamate synthesis protein (capsule biosynthesis protein)
LRAFLVGQALARFDFRHCIDDYFTELLELSTGADVFFSNLEAAIRSPLGGQQTKMGKYFVAGEPEALDSLKALGINLLALSDNHSYDMGTDGILATREEVRRRGFVHAGSGANIAEASAPGYLETPHGTVALIAMASGGLDPGAPAAPSRAGINELRVDPDGVLHPDDLRRNLAAVEEAASRADYVFVYQHSHYWEPDWQDTPPWQREFARLCIDAGAAAFCGHGAPLIHGIELYKDRPILYSLGNFIFQLFPDETYGQEPVWQSVVADARFQRGELASMRLYPILLNKETLGGQVYERTGLPYLARGSGGERILERLARLCRHLGTEVHVAHAYAEVQV